MVKIALGMIVKNEAHCIERCLDSVKPFIDAVVINDNGSTDGTQEKIFDWCMDNKILPIEIFDMPWRSFDENRSAVLEKLYRDYKDIDYVLMIDADEVLVQEAGFNPEKFKESLVCDLYDVKCKLGGTEYLRPQLSSNKKKFSYRGVVHEFIHCEEELKTRGTAEGFFNMPIQDSARNKDPEKYKKDAEALKKAFDETTDPFLKSRYCFYLAQCYKDSFQNDLAVEYYLKRLDHAFWDEEKYMALVHAGRLMKSKDTHKKDFIDAFGKAVQYSQNRIEAFYELMIAFKEVNSFYVAYMFGREALKRPKNPGSLFLENWIHDWAAPWEMSIICFYVGDKELGKTLTQFTIENKKAPPNVRAQAKENLKFYE